MLVDRLVLRALTLKAWSLSLRLLELNGKVHLVGHWLSTLQYVRPIKEWKPSWTLVSHSASG